MIKLNIKRFGTTITSSGAWETGADAGNNLSYVYATFTQKAASNTYNQSGSAYYTISCDGKSTGKVNFKFAKGSTLTFNATLGPFYHAADGSLGNKTVTIYVNGDVKNGTHTMNHPVPFTKFARGFSSIPTLTLQSKTNTKFTFKWNTSESASGVYYDLYNSAGTLITSSGNVGSGTTGTFNITGLSGNTTYKVRIRAQRADSGLWDNGTSSTGTYVTYITPTLSLSLTSRTETSLKVKATPNVAVASKSWTVKNSSGTTVKTSTSTAETVEFTGLSANANYTVSVSYVSTSANGSLSGSGSDTYTTLQYPSISGVGTAALPIGNSQKLTLYNPLGRNVTVYMKKDSTSGTQLYSGTTTSASITFTPNATTLYSTIPNATSGNAVYYCVYNNVNVGTKSGTYITKGTETPTFGTSNWSYTADLTALTNNNQVVIPNYSTVTFKLDAVATGKNSATISSYSVNWGGEVALGGTAVGTTKSIAKKASSSLSMIAIDSRNYRTTSTRNLQSGTTYIPYTSPTVTSISTHRTDGIQAETTLDINGKFYATNFGGSTGSYTNTLYSVQYYTKASTSSTWSGPYSIPLSNFTINTTNGTFSIDDFKIHANGTSGGFVVGTRYDIKVEIKDAKGLLGMVTATSSVTDGKIARDVYQDSNGEYHEGINGRANSSYTQKVHGSLNTTGNIYPGGQVRKDGGSSWVKDRDAATVRNNNGSNDGAYHPVVSQKTKDGNWTIGQISGDNSLKFNYTTDSNYNNNNNTSMQGLYFTNGGGAHYSDTVQIDKSSIGPLILKRTDGANASVMRFDNTNGMLGAIGMTGAAGGRLQRWNKDYATGYEIIDRSIVTTSATSGNTNVITSGGVYSAINGKLIDSSGTNWIRYQDGTQMCWGSIDKSNVAITSPWGSLYECGPISLGNFPKAFKTNTIPQLFLQCAGGGYAVTAETVNPTATSLGSCYFYRPTAVPSAGITIFYFAIGKWK